MKKRLVKQDDIAKIRELQDEIYSIVKKNNDRKNAERIVIFSAIYVDEGEIFRAIRETIVGSAQSIVGILLERAREIIDGSIAKKVKM